MITNVRSPHGDASTRKEPRDLQLLRLHLTAPPRALGTLHGEYSNRLKQAIRLEIVKDFARMPVFEIERTIASHTG